MSGGTRVRSVESIRRDAYQLFLALTRLVIDPLVAGQVPGHLHAEPAANAVGLTE